MSSTCKFTLLGFKPGGRLARKTRFSFRVTRDSLYGRYVRIEYDWTRSAIKLSKCSGCAIAQALAHVLNNFEMCIFYIYI